MKILITGAGGFLGFHLAKRCIEQGHEVTNFSRGTYPKLDYLGVRTVQGDIRDKNAVKKAVKGQDAIFHVASKVGVWGSYQEYYDINVEGTIHMLDAAKEEGIDKFIFTSSPSVVFGVDDLNGVDESYPYPEKYVCAYAKTKALAESEVLKRHDPKNFKTVALRPHLIFGPGDHNLIPRIITKAKKNKLKIIGDGQNLVDVVYIDNAIDAHMIALEKIDTHPEIGGQSFFISQEKPVKLWEFINKILMMSNFKPVKKKVPSVMAYQLSYLIEKAMFWSQKEPPLTRFVVLNLSKSHYFNTSRATNILGYTPKISLEKSMDLTHKWMREQNMVND